MTKKYYRVIWIHSIAKLYDELFSFSSHDRSKIQKSQNRKLLPTQIAYYLSKWNVFLTSSRIFHIFMQVNQNANKIIYVFKLTKWWKKSSYADCELKIKFGKFEWIRLCKFNKIKLNITHCSKKKTKKVNKRTLSLAIFQKKFVYLAQWRLF